MTRITKTTSEVDRLTQQLATQEKKVSDAFKLFILAVNDETVLKQINDLLDAGNIEAALDIVDTYLIRFSNVLNNVFSTVGEAESAVLASAIGSTAIGISFNPIDPQSVAVLQEARLNLIRELTEKQRDSTRQALVRAFQEGEGPRQTAAAFKNSIGLTAKQEQAVVNFRTLLETNDSRALERSIRDRRFDRTVERAISTSEPLKKTQVDKMVQRYRERFVLYRAEVIARTEGVRATSMARDQALRQTLDITGIPKENVERTWVPVAGPRTRDAHASMRNQKVGLDETFSDGDGNQLRYPGDPSAPIETTAQCRCVLTIKFKKQ